MTERERLLAILASESPDRIPWIPRLKIWYTAHQRLGTLPDRFRDRSLREVERSLGLGTPARDGKVCRVTYRDLEVRQQQHGLDTITEYVTPLGTVRFVKRRSAEEAHIGVEEEITVEHPLKTPADYAVWAYIVDHTVYEPTYEEFAAYDQEIGADGLPMVNAGDCPFHYWLKELAGYEYGYLHLQDFPAAVEDLLLRMTEKENELWAVVAQSPARLILHGTHFSTQLTPPPYFARYIVPYYQEFSRLLHAHGKSLALHADNDTSRLLGLIPEAGYDMAECFATAPIASVTLAEARAAWDGNVIIWGGVPSTILEPFVSEEDFTAYMRDLFRTIAPGDAFILGVSDNVMPGALLSRIERITEMVEQYGHYPVQVA